MFHKCEICGEQIPQEFKYCLRCANHLANGRSLKEVKQLTYERKQLEFENIPLGMPTRWA